MDYSITQTAIQLSQQGMDIKKTFTQEIIAMLREQARPEALDRLKRTLVLGEIAKKESLAVEPDAVQAKVEEQLAEYRERGMDDDIDLERLREAVEDDLLREKIFAWLEENNTIELVPEGSLQPAEPEAEGADAAAVETPTESSAPETSEAAASETTVDVEAIDVEAVPAESAPEPTTPSEAVAAPAETAEAPETVEPSEAPAEKPAKAKTAAKKSSKSTESAKKSRTSKQSS
ncbi:hypothetical protein [Leptolyngbya sp. 7M]|uniref:hypothetical protein n=1 Tax=Leptolyngbya sp. 7M TaxID=2812896 RepID=UPI001B8BD155|nr:hypothetical protein [Leptolyngbya sp. 7M]QYO62435.1 hypothetical protein JVX88_20405 [Leptolyngbya sp. 7M]